jgi:hypothetical protein
MLLRLALFWSGGEFAYQDPLFLFVLLAAFPGLAIYAIWPRSAVTGFAADAKKSMQITLLYGLLITVFLYCYFTWIDVTYFANRHEQFVENELRADPSLDRADLISKVSEFFSVRNFTVLVLLSCIIMSAFYSVLFAALKRFRPGGAKI